MQKIEGRHLTSQTGDCWLFGTQSHTSSLGVSSIKYVFSVFARDLREGNGRLHGYEYEYEYGKDLQFVMGICLRKNHINQGRSRTVKNHGLLQELEIQRSAKGLRLIRFGAIRHSSILRLLCLPISLPASTVAHPRCKYTCVSHYSVN